jgi:uncharacterized membrane protein
VNSLFKVSSVGAYSLLALAVVIVLSILLVPLLVLGIAGAAFSRLGFSWMEAVAVLLLMLAGSLVNIPLPAIRAMRNRGLPAGATVFDAFTGEPVPDEQSTVTLSLNLGGAVIPAAVCVFLLYGAGRVEAGSLALPLALCLGIVTIATFLSTTVLPGWGIRAPLVLPAFAALASGFFLGGGTGLAAGVIAFVGGTMGALTGATARCFSRGIGAGVRQISIGGAGMFGPVFLCAILAALVA